MNEFKINISKFIEQYEKVSKLESKLFGEVFTPRKLIDEMLDTLPTEIWKKKDLKWLDPAVGIGNFPAAIVDRLMVGLEEEFPDESERRKWILEEMLFMCDISTKNLFLLYMLFDKNNEFKLNVYRGSFLTEEFDKHMKNVWKLDGFDVIVGNPPYNAAQEAKGKRGGGSTLWDKFVIKSISDLKKNAYLCFVHPTLWRKPQSEKSSSREVSELMMNKQIHYLEIHSTEDGIRTFGAGTRYDFYLLENCDIYKNTIIIDENGSRGEINLKNLKFIPNLQIDFFSKILAKDNEPLCPIIFNRTNYGSDKDYVSSIKDETHIYPLIHSTPKSGNRIFYSSRNDRGHFGISKIIFGESGIYDVIIDMEGQYGMTQHSMAIKVDSIDEANKIKEVLMSERFTDFIKSSIWSNFAIDWRLFTYLKKDFWKEFI